MGPYGDIQVGGPYYCDNTHMSHLANLYLYFIMFYVLTVVFYNDQSLFKRKHFEVLKVAVKLWEIYVILYIVS